MKKNKDTNKESLAEIAVDPDVLAKELALELEKEVKLIVSKFNKEELILIEDKLSGVPATTSAKKLGLGERTLQRKQKELFEKFSKLLVKLQIDYGDEFSQGDILDTFRTEVIYSVKV